MSGMTIDQLSARGVAKGNEWQRRFGGGTATFAMVQVLEHLGIAPEAAAMMAYRLAEDETSEVFMNALLTATVCYEEKLGVQL